MTFIAHVSYWCEYINSGKGGYKNTHCILVAENLHEAMDYICSYYGEEYIEQVTFEAFSPDQMLEFDEADVNEYATFCEIVSQLSPKVIW